MLDRYDETSQDFNYDKSLKGFNPDRLIGKLTFVDNYLNRPTAAVIVRLVYHTRITPNGLTYISFFLGLVAALLFSFGEYLFFISGGILAQISSIVDGADGMLARSKNISSDFGSHLDLIFDRVNDFLLFVGISFGAYFYYGSTRLLVMGLLAAGLYLLQVNLFYLTKSYLKVEKKGDSGEARALMILLIMFFALANRLDITIYLGLAETVAVCVIRLIYFIGLGRKKTERHQ